MLIILYIIPYIFATLLYNDVSLCFKLFFLRFNTTGIFCVQFAVCL